MKRTTLLFVSFGAVFLPLSLASAGDCPRAIDLFNQGTISQDVGIKTRHFKEALDQSCEDPNVRSKIHNNLADVYENQGKFPEAITEYKKAIELEPAFPTPYISLGDIYSKLKDLKTAEVYYKKYRELTFFKNKEHLVSALNPESKTRAIQVRPVTGQKSEASEDLYFGFNEMVLTKESERQLQELLSALNQDELKKYRFQISGYTCNLGSDAYNQKLSERRARAVKDWLVEMGYPARQLQTAGYGKQNPVADNSTEEGRKLNRRVEIRTISGKD